MESAVNLDLNLDSNLDYKLGDKEVENKLFFA